MNWREESLGALRRTPLCSYFSGGPVASEATALSCIALARRNMRQEAMLAARWLADLQSEEGSVGVYEKHARPRWPTSLACLAWNACDDFADGEFDSNLKRALAWVVTLRGDPVEDPDDNLGHDTKLVAWPWVEGSHSWIEPTAMHILALKVSGHFEHARTREGVLMLRDRLLDSGGCNYGNTRVFDQNLLPHVQPTGLSLMALVGEADIDGRMARSLDYLQAQISRTRSVTSTSWALLGLAAHQRSPAQAEELLSKAHQRYQTRKGPAYKLALLLLADPANSWSAELVGQFARQRSSSLSAFNA